MGKPGCFELLLKLLIVGELKTSDPVRLQAVSTPDPPHRALADIHALGHQPSTPVRRVLRLFLRGQPNNLIHRPNRNLLLASWPRCVFLDTIKAKLMVTIAPAPCLLSRDTQCLGNLSVGLSLCG